MSVRIHERSFFMYGNLAISVGGLRTYIDMDREEILAACFNYVSTRVSEVEQAIESANNSLTEDTKSSAGDKYETGREMIQQDLNRLQQQLVIANADKSVLERISSLPTPSIVSVGSLVQTDNGLWYFIAISMGRLAGHSDVYVISPKSPIGELLLGKQLGDSIVFNGRKFTIAQLS